MAGAGSKVTAEPLDGGGDPVRPLPGADDERVVIDARHLLDAHRRVRCGEFLQFVAGDHRIVVEQTALGPKQGYGRPAPIEGGAGDIVARLLGAVGPHGCGRCAASDYAVVLDEVV